ncbi:MAG TPA: tripartite tricarboxylate transporter TctB family protein [Acetobacteraceae bacterium]|nr:tripartite tricarboxylate transporter TctB family protein [Acetobacteraceae bacterium]
MKDWFLAVAVMVGACTYLYADYHIPTTELGDPLGPRAFPALIGLLLLISAALLMIETVRRGPDRGSTPDVVRPTHYPILAGMLVWTICYYAAFEPAGYIVATVIYLFGLLCFFNAGRHVVNVAVAAGFTATAYGVFSQFLGVQLPSGPLGF